MTSNVGTQESSKAVGFTASAGDKGSFTAHLNQFFRPEFLNRLDEIIIFNPLSEEIVSKILDLEMTAIHDRLAQQGFELQLADDARAFLLRKGFDPVNGARPLRRAIERYITRPLSARIVEEAFTKGAAIHASVADAEDSLRFDTEADEVP
jgi:ATP-dependent Clp protease ATP-binding subunit ClpA